MELAAATIVPSMAILKRYRIKESRFMRAEHENTVWAATVDAGTPFDEVLKPDYWSHIAGPKKLRAGDKIEIYPDEGHYYALLYVRDVGPQWAKVHVISKTDFDLSEARQDERDADFYVEFKAPRTTKWCVVRRADKEIMHSGEVSRADAEIWLQNYRKALAA
jgi:hypothetical protein